MEIKKSLLPTSVTYSGESLPSGTKIPTLFEINESSSEKIEEHLLYREVTDRETIERLDSQPTIKVYRAMQLIDGGLRPPMSAKVNGELREATKIGVWEEAEERPELADNKGKFTLNKGNGKSINAAYNPYIHTSRSPINDQFSSAWSRPELVTVEVEVPESELTSNYKADKAKDSVGEKEWKSGPVGRQLAKVGDPRLVILSRWDKVVRIVPINEVAEAYAERLIPHGISVPFNTVPPALRDALAKRGITISEPEKGNAGDAARPAYEEWVANSAVFRESPSTSSLASVESTQERIAELAERLHLDNVEVVTDASTLEGKKQRAKGFYDKQTGKITIVLPNHADLADVEQTLLHEAAAHDGLRAGNYGVDRTDVEQTIESQDR